jgi:hypothetical protein
METLQAMKVNLTENPFHLGIETVVRRWFVLRVDLEVFTTASTPSPNTSSSAAYASSAGSTPPGRNTTACRVDIGASVLAVLLGLNQASARRHRYWQHDRCVSYAACPYGKPVLPRRLAPVMAVEHGLRS